MNWFQAFLVRLIMGHKKELNALCMINGTDYRVSIEAGFIKRLGDEQEIDRKLAEELRDVFPTGGC